MRRFGSWTMALAVVINLAACVGEDESLEAIDEEDELADDGKYEAWNQANNPAFVDSTFVYDIDQIPVEGHAKTPPWSGDYWATQRDSINHRWDGSDSLSPAEKIEAAFGLTGFSKKITDNFGIYGHGRRACDQDSECADLMDGSACAKPRGATGDKAGRCIPGWWGICHGWAPAAFAEPAPVKPVVRNGVTFYPGDLEGLMSLAYSENLPTKFISERCNKESVRFDNTGRPVAGESACFDTNGGTFLVVVGNMLGLRQTSLVEDRTYTDQVWNQPVRGYKITNAVGGKLKEVPLAEALRLLGLDLSFTSVLAETTIAKDARQSGVYTATASGELTIKMSGTGDADLYVKKGATPTDAVYDCRPYEGSSSEVCKLTVASGDQVHWLITGFAATSKVALGVGVPGSSNGYQYNPRAKRFFHIEMDFQYITESQPARESHVDVIDNYTVTDHYSFLVETDLAGKIIGGEWLGASNMLHPDFLWWPSGKPTGTLPGGLTYAMVKEMNDEAADRATLPGPAGETTVLFSNEKVVSASKYATVGVPGGKTLTVTMTGTGSGNADLYVKIGRKPTLTSFDRASTGATSSETVSVTAPGAGGTYYVRVRPTTGTSFVNVTATIR